MAKVKNRSTSRRRIRHTDSGMFKIWRNKIVRRERIPFSSGLQRRMKVRRNQARCHSISLDCMAAIVENLVNLYADQYGDDNVAGAIQYYLSELGYVVINLGAIQTCNPNMHDVYVQYNEKVSQINDVGSIQELLQYANDIVVMLNESSFNLRVGDKRINSSISYSFDPKSWIYVVNGKHIDGQHMEWQTGNNGYEDGLYLTDSTDAVRVSTIYTILDELGMDYPFGIDVYRMEDEECMKYIVASSNNLYINMAALEPYQITGWEIQDGKRMLLKVCE